MIIDGKLSSKQTHTQISEWTYDCIDMTTERLVDARNERVSMTT